MRKFRRGRPPEDQLRDWYEFKAQADPTTAELKIFGPIGGGFFFDEDAVTGKSVAEQLEGLPESVNTIRVLVDSPGGSVFDAIHIANALRRQREEHGRAIHVEVEALAASAATIITSAGDTVRMPRNALMMVHNPFALGIGDSKVMRGLADVLDKVRSSIVATYKWISKLSAESIESLMDATTWMDADEALENGFATEITDAVEAAAMLDEDAVEFLGEIPEEYRADIQATDDVIKRIGRIFSSAPTVTDDPGDTDGNEGGDASASVEPSEGKMSKPNETDSALKPVPDAKAIKAAERERVAQLEKMAAGGRAAGIDVDAMLISAKADDTTPEVFSTQILNMLADKSDTCELKDVAGKIDVDAGEDVHDKRVAGMSAALWRRAGVTGTIREAAKKDPDHPTFQGLDFDGGEFRGMSLYDLAREDVERQRPGATKGKSRMEVVGLFFNAAGGYQTTSDFAVALENTLHKSLLAAFAIAPDTWRSICGVGSVSDFRAHNRYRTGYLASLDQIFESGEFNNKAIPDAVKETITALTYGNIVSLSRQAIINDDMGVFNRVAQQLGRAAALTIESTFYTELAKNSGLGPLMNDGVALFNAAHANLGAGAALSVAAIEANRVILASQQDPNSQEYLDIRPSVLLVPIGLEGTAKIINESQFDVDSGVVTNTPNKVVGLFATVVGTPRITGTRRYMFANPATMPTFEVAFLEGEQEPFMEMQDGWRIDGVEWKVRHDFGVAAVEYRSALTDAGA